MTNSISLGVIFVVLVTTGPSTFGGSAPDLEQRVAAQTAIEDVYWRHRIWPADNPAPKPSLGQVLPASVVRARVEDYLQESQTLERLWARRIKDEDLQAEVERMTASSRAPQVLQEIFAALGNDPVLVAECLARPLIADRWIRDAYARDPRFHGALKTAIEQSLARHPSAVEAKSLGGEYGETVWMRGSGRPEKAVRLAGGRVVRLDEESWRTRLASLKAGLVGVFGDVQEDDESFFAQAVLEKDSDRLRVATAVWRKKPFDEWWALTKTTLDASPSPEAVPNSSGEAAPSLPELAPAACTPDTWSAVQSTGAPVTRLAHTAVWTGTEMIVWGGYNETLEHQSGGRYNPATDSWTATSTGTNVPAARDAHTAVWTGSKMVVWGGNDGNVVPLDTGGRYDPTTNTWLATKTTGAPTARTYHTAVWSGSRMIVWGGSDHNFNDLSTGALYDPVGDSWGATKNTGAPTSRHWHTAVWSGTRMVVWGGQDDAAVPAAQNTGSRYNPVDDSWSATTTTNVPAARFFHAAVWTGSKMIVWGGDDGASDQSTGGIYDPNSLPDTWTATSTAGAPAAREQHVAVWTDSLSEVDVWGGQDDAVVQLNTGGRYNPTTNTWTAMSTLASPIGGRYHTVVWTGSEMIPWGGYNVVALNSGGRYCSGACVSSPPAGSSTLSASKQPGTVLFSWTAVPAAAAYDVVRGGLNLLRSSGGNFTTSTQACLANDQVGTSAFDPAAPAVADGFWYLLRGSSCGGAGTYDESVASQIGGRDAEINASPNTCP
jgi:N-acetylneuraminic acid mutarotase